MKPIALPAEATSLPRIAPPGGAATVAGQAPFEQLFALIAPVEDAGQTAVEIADFSIPGNGLPQIPYNALTADTTAPKVPELSLETPPDVIWGARDDTENPAAMPFFLTDLAFAPPPAAVISAPALMGKSALTSEDLQDGEIGKTAGVSPDLGLFDAAGAGMPPAQAIPSETANAAAQAMPAQLPAAPEAPRDLARNNVSALPASLPPAPPQPAPPEPERDRAPVARQNAAALPATPIATAEFSLPKTADATQPMPQETGAQETGAQDRSGLPEPRAHLAPAPAAQKPALVVQQPLASPAKTVALPPAQPAPLTAPLAPAAAANLPPPLAGTGPRPANLAAEPAPLRERPKAAAPAIIMPPVAPIAGAELRPDLTGAELTALRQRGENAAPTQEAVQRVDFAPMAGTAAPTDGPVAPRVQVPQNPLANAPLPETALNMRHGEWGRQLLDRIERASRDGSELFEISLRPKTLGALRINLELQGERTSVHFVTETGAAARMLLGSEEKLSQLLDQSGFKLGGFSAQGGGAGGQNGQPNKERMALRNSKRPGATAPAAPASAPLQGAARSGVNMLA